MSASVAETVDLDRARGEIQTIVDLGQRAGIDSGELRQRLKIFYPMVPEHELASVIGIEQDELRDKVSKRDYEEAQATTSVYFAVARENNQKPVSVPHAVLDTKTAWLVAVRAGLRDYPELPGTVLCQVLAGQRYAQEQAKRGAEAVPSLSMPAYNAQREAFFREDLGLTGRELKQQGVSRWPLPVTQVRDKFKKVWGSGYGWHRSLERLDLRATKPVRTTADECRFALLKFAQWAAENDEPLNGGRYQVWRQQHTVDEPPTRQTLERNLEAKIDGKTLPNLIDIAREELLQSCREAVSEFFEDQKPGEDYDPVLYEGWHADQAEEGIDYPPREAVEALASDVWAKKRTKWRDEDAVRQECRTLFREFCLSYPESDTPPSNEDYETWCAGQTLDIEPHPGHQVVESLGRDIPTLWERWRSDVQAALESAAEDFFAAESSTSMPAIESFYQWMRAADERLPAAELLSAQRWRALWRNWSQGAGSQARVARERFFSKAWEDGHRKADYTTLKLPYETWRQDHEGADGGALPPWSQIEVYGDWAEKWPEYRKSRRNEKWLPAIIPSLVFFLLGFVVSLVIPWA